jgi:hypothetical protein
MRSAFIFLSAGLSAVLASPSGLDALQPRAAADNTVYVTSTDKFW